jgi:alpha-tubulin suppressor-like RCC1 family protein
MKKYIFILLMLITANISNAQCWTAISTCQAYVFGIQKDSSLWMWGTASGYGFGDSLYSSVYKAPMQYHPGKWLSVSSNGNSCLLIKADGTLWGFGDNSKSHLGHPSNLLLTKLTQIGIDTDWAYICVGDQGSIALKKNGTLWATGEDRNGSLGLGMQNLGVQFGFKQVGAASDWVLISFNSSEGFAIKQNGTLWNWGDYHWLGDSSTANVNVPKQMGTDTDWVKVASAGSSTKAIKKNGTLWAWGDNSSVSVSNTFGGPATQSWYYKPVQVSADTNWNDVTYNYYLSFATKKDGSLWVCGDNSKGLYGDGTTQSTSIFKQVGQGISWKSAKAGYLNAIGISTTGELFTWGINLKYALGIGDYKDTTIMTPNMIGNFCAPLANNNITTKANSFLAYPNPAIDFINIEITPAHNNAMQTIKMYDVFGKLVFSKLLNMNTTFFTIDVANMAKGIYYINYNNTIKKVIVS